jgi:hypothetical protein
MADPVPSSQSLFSQLITIDPCTLEPR